MWATWLEQDWQGQRQDKGSLAGRPAPQNYPCLCSPEPRCTLHLAVNLGWTTQAQGGGGGQALPPGLTHVLVGCAQSAPGCLVDRRLQECTQCA